RLVTRRDFLRASGGTAALVGAAAFIPSLRGAGGQGGHAAHGAAMAHRAVPPGLAPDVPRSPLRLANEATPNQLRLVAAKQMVDVAPGVQFEGFLLNGSLPSPLLRARTGDPFEVLLDN